MTADWTLLATCWALYALDNIHLARTRQTHWLTHLGLPARARLKTLSWRLTGLLPTTWRHHVQDLPFSFSPEGIANRPVGQTFRPAEPSIALQAYRWDDLQALELRSGWIYFNQQKFCRDTGHLTYDQWRALINQVTAASLPAREKLLRAQLAALLRPAHLRRRTRVLCARTGNLTTFTATTALLTFLATVYHLAGLSAHLPKPVSAHIAHVLPTLLLLCVVLHLTAVILAYRARKKLFRRQAPRTKDLGVKLVSALLLPPQALKLRSLLGDAYLPATLPIAAALAYSPAAERDLLVFQTLADLDHPLTASDAPDHPAPRIAAWHRQTLRDHLHALLPAHGIEPARLLAPPTPDTPRSCAYCPRCHDQFTQLAAHCPHGIQLRPLATPVKPCENPLA